MGPGVVVQNDEALVLQTCPATNDMAKPDQQLQCQHG